MKLTTEELNEISIHLCHLASECHLMYDEAKISSRLVGCYDETSYKVVSRLQDVLRRADKLLDELHCVSSTLDSLLIRHKVLDDSEMI